MIPESQSLYFNVCCGTKNKVLVELLLKLVYTSVVSAVKYLRDTGKGSGASCFRRGSSWKNSPRIPTQATSYKK